MLEHTRNTSRRARRSLRGFTLLESLMASAILLGIVTAVTSAIIAGQQNSYQAQQQISATLAADALMARLVAEEYTKLPQWHRYREEVGAMIDEFGQPMPPAFDGIGREVHVEASFQRIDPPGVSIRGRMVTVAAFDADDLMLIVLQRFVPEPQS